jgi:hypothetical protein
VTQHHDRLSLAVRLNVRRLDGAADHRWHAEKVEGVPGQQDAVKALGREFPGHQHRLDRRSHHVGERRQLGERPKFVERIGASATTVDGADLRSPNLRRFCVGVWVDEHAVDHAEDRRGRADAEREGEERYDYE